MGTSLNGLTPANTYQALIKVGNNTNLNTTLKTLSDGAGNDLPMQASTTAINFTGTVSGVASGVSGAIQFSNGSAFASDAANLFWDDTNNRLGVGTNAPTATTHIVGANNLANSYALKVLNLANQGILSVTNDGFTQIGDFTGAGYGANLSFLRSSGGTRATTFNQGNQNLSITNVNGNVTFQNTPVQVVGSGSTSATTALLVQNSGSNTSLRVYDDRIVEVPYRIHTPFIRNENGNLVLYSGNFEVEIQSSNPTSTSGSLRTTGEITTTDNQTKSIINVNNLVPSTSASFNTLNGFAFTSTITQTTGIIRGLFINPTLNASTDFRAIQTTSGGAYINTSTPQSSACLQADSTTQGFLPPRMTTTQKNAISSPATGLQVFDTTMNATCEYTGTAWRVVSAGAQAVTVTGLLQTISLANGNVLDITLNSTTTFTFTNPTIGTYILKLTQGVGGGFLVNWPVNVIWSGGTAPTLSTTAGKIDIITLIYDGTSYYGNYSLNY
jgi:hypothetical protein